MSQWKKNLRCFVGADRANYLLSRSELAVTQKPNNVPSKKEVIAAVVKSEVIKTELDESDSIKIIGNFLLKFFDIIAKDEQFVLIPKADKINELQKAHAPVNTAAKAQSPQPLLMPKPQIEETIKLKKNKLEGVNSGLLKRLRPAFPSR